MLKKSGEKYGEKIAYKIRQENGYKEITHNEVRKMVDGLGTKLIDMGLKDKRIAVIGENRYEWEIAYLSIVCGTGTVVPLDKSLPENELESLIERSKAEAIICSQKYVEILKKTKLKYIISMDLEKDNDGILNIEIKDASPTYALPAPKEKDSKYNPIEQDDYEAYSYANSKSMITIEKENGMLIFMDEENEIVVPIEFKDFIIETLKKLK